ncbi:hypothetical protein LTS08_008883 [Lithohypha guttulata]|uniref:uncharacterized protein n=1 Tax=Lithohypha guttulata TaxID=1690604 RepID=UPI002DE0EDC4|nr:hypothetical protein LTS08_008883 [Lithohypha guttulata]
MENTRQSDSTSLIDDARVSLALFIAEHPSPRRVSRIEERNIIDWLNNPDRRPTTQEEFSRRNYVRKSFVWDEHESKLLTTGKNGSGHLRVVVLTDEIVDVVERVHQASGHSGWDATWNTINDLYYGILRHVVFVLKILENGPRAQLVLQPGLKGISQTLIDAIKRRRNRLQIPYYQKVKSVQRQAHTPMNQSKKKALM